LTREQASSRVSLPYSAKYLSLILMGFLPTEELLEGYEMPSSSSLSAVCYDFSEPYGSTWPHHWNDLSFRASGGVLFVLHPVVSEYSYSIPNVKPTIKYF